MSGRWGGALGVLVFVLFLSVWNWITTNLPGSVSGHLNWIVLLVAAIAAIVVYLKTTER